MKDCNGCKHHAKPGEIVAVKYKVAAVTPSGDVILEDGSVIPYGRYFYWSSPVKEESRDG